MKVIIISSIFIILLIRFVYLSRINKNNSFLFISTYIQILIFPFTFLVLYKLPLPENEVSGAFTQSISIDFISILSLMFFILKKPKKNILTYQNNKILNIMLLFFLFSFLNPFNNFRIAAIPPLFVVLQIYLFLYIAAKRMMVDEIIKGIFDGFLIVTIIQFFLTILFPILNYAPALEFFYQGDTGASFWAYRRDGYPSAVGTFVHPGNLALFINLSSVFFYSCIQNNFKRKVSIVLILLNVFIILNTFSRASYIAFIVTIFILFYSKSNNLFSVKKSFKSLPYIFFVLILLFITPLFDLFFKSDSIEMLDARFLQFSFVSQFLEFSHWLGVGINSHVYYMFNFFRGFPDEFDFFLSNPIHNVFLIVLVETGIIGLFFLTRFFFYRIKYNLAFYEPSEIQLLNRSFAGCLIVFLIYGSSGWAGFTEQIYPIVILFGFFSIYKYKK